MASSILTLRLVTVVSAIEALLIIKLSPSYAETQAHGIWICKSPVRAAWCLCAINYALLCCYSVVIHPELISQLRHIPYAERWIPRIIHHWFVGKGNQAQLLLEIARNTPNDGIISLWELSRRRLLITKPQILADLLVHRPYDFEKPENMRNFLGNIVGNGIFVVEGEQHKFLRKYSLHAFSYRRIKDLYPMMLHSSYRFMDRLEAEIKDQSQRSNTGQEVSTSGHIEMTAWANSTAMSIIGSAVFGRDFSARDNPDDRLLLDSFRVIFDPTKEMLIYFVLSAWVSFRVVRILPWKMNTIFSDTTTTLRRICLKWVRNRREAAKQDNKQVDLLSLLLEPGILDDNQVVDQLLTYMAAGHDTTALTFVWACYMLAINPDQQSALRSEINNALPLARNGVVTPAADGEDAAGIMERLPLLNGIINETLRLYPAVPVTIRRATRDTALGEQRIPKTTEVLVSPWVINRSQELWGLDADDFRPERWIHFSAQSGDWRGEQGDDRHGLSHAHPNNTGGTSNYDTATFLHGPRSCIGQTFARAELRCLLSAMVSRFEWTLDMDPKDVVPGGAITIRPQNGLFLRLKPLNL